MDAIRPELSEIMAASRRLKPILHHTELDLSSTFSRMTGGNIYLKCENRQKTGSFKIRGATNKLSAMVERGETRPVVASSAGNHAREEEGAAFLHPYNDLEVIAGQGTLGLEILGDLPTVDIIITPAGGGGLLAGVLAAVKQINPRVKVYGVQAEGANAIAQSFREKRLVTTATASTIADGIAVKSPGDITVDIINRYADGVVTVSDIEIANAILQLIERCKMIVEPAGATPLAAVLNGKIDVKGKNVVCLLSGGNIDVSFVQSIIEQGMAASHRRIRFTARLLDKPGSLVQVLSILADSGANILTIEHDKLAAGLNPNETKVHIACEVGGKAHGQAVLDELKNHGYEVELD